MKKETYCQSCGLPFDEKGELYGTEADGGPSGEYCRYCYQNGRFVEDLTMDEMIDKCVPFLVNGPMKMDESAALSMMKAQLPNLRRWESAVPREEMERKAEALLEKTAFVTLASVTADGYPRGCILVKVANRGFRTVYVSTGTTSRKTGEFLANPKAGLSYGDEKDGVTLLGAVRVLNEKAQKAPYWQEWMGAHFPKGPDDPDFCVLEFTAEEATLWIDGIFRTYRY